MKRIIASFCFFVCAMAPLNHAFAGGWEDTANDLPRLRDAIAFYQELEGIKPNSDDESSWFHKIVHRGVVSAAEFETVGDMPQELPADVFGQPYVLQYVDDTIVIRSVGRNGTDDSGAGDDWDSRFGPNWGYWYKQNYPLAAGLACASFLISFAIAILLRHSWRWMLAVSAIPVGIAMAMIPFFADGMLFTPSQFAPASMEWIVLGGCALLVVAIPSVAIMTFQYIARSKRVGSGYCKRCGYSLVGGPHRRCPECGTDVVTTA